MDKRMEKVIDAATQSPEVLVLDKGWCFDIVIPDHVTHRVFKDSGNCMVLGELHTPIHVSAAKLRDRCGLDIQL